MFSSSFSVLVDSLHAFIWLATSALVAIENQGEGDYFMVDSEDAVYEYDTSLKQLRKTGLKLFEYILKRFESVS